MEARVEGDVAYFKISGEEHKTSSYSWTTVSMIDNEKELLEEDIECVHMFLDDKGAPRENLSNEDGYHNEMRTLSIVGRIKALLGEK